MSWKAGGRFASMFECNIDGSRDLSLVKNIRVAVSLIFCAGSVANGIRMDLFVATGPACPGRSEEEPPLGSAEG
jgi:hypothetical protein